MLKRGFALVEIMTVVGIIGLISAITVPNFIKARSAAQEAVCFKDRNTLEEQDSLFFLQEGRHTDKLEELVQFGYMKKLPVCPNKGTLSWTSNDSQNPYYKTFLRCSVHGLTLSVGGTALVDVNGSDYAGSSGRWTKMGTDIVTYWGNQWVDYKFNFEEGGRKYKLSVSAKNNA